jgi:gliding motility-associated-like protein
MRIKLFNLIAFFFLISITSFGQYNMATNNGQTITTCSGTFTDSGGTSSQYSNNENYTITFCSNNGLPLNFDFTTFDLDTAGDQLSFYNGTMATGTPIAVLDWLDDSTQVGTSSQLQIGTLSTCVTIKWTSNASSIDGGWVATVSCIAPPSCGGNPAAADIFGQATPICNLNSYCGNLSSYYGEDTPFNIRGGGDCPTPTDGMFGGTIENNSWLSFQASSNSATFDFNVPCGTDGIQVGIFGFDGSNFSLKSPCAITDGTNNGTFSVTGSNLTVCETYYIMIDGIAGATCNYSISANNGVVVANAGADQTICSTSTNLTANVATTCTTGTWTVITGTGNFANANSPTSSVSGLSNGTNVFRWTLSSGFCNSFDEITITVNGGSATTIAYPSSSVANTVTAAQNITITNGPVTGNYTATPTGLDINVTTGAVIPSTSAIGTYTISVPTACGTATTTLAVTAVPCGSCASATCPISGPYTNYSNAIGAAHTSNCQTISPNIIGPNIYLSYYTVVASTSGNIGAIVSNDNTPNTCTTSRTAVLYLNSTNCNSSTTALIPINGSNGSTFYNPEWTGLTPGATYIMVVTTAVASGCEIQDQCVSYYQPTTALGCTTCATATCTPASIITTTAVLGQTGITTAINSAGDVLGLTPLTPGQSVTVCVPVTVVSNSTLLGFKQKFEASSGCANVSEQIITYQLRPASNCNASPIIPNRLNAANVGSGFNPEWDNLAAGNYVLCFTLSVTNLSICNPVDLQGLGYYNVVPTSVPCQDYQIQLYDDDSTSIIHTGSTFSCTDPGVYLGPTADPTVYDSGLPYQNYNIFITALTGSLNNLVLNRYDAGTNVLAEALTVTPGQVVQNYFLRPAPGQYYKLDKTNAQSGTYSYTIVDVISGATVASGTWTITAGAESASSISLIPQGTANYSGSGVTNGFDVTGVNNYTNDRGIGFFNPSLAGAGTHTITYTWNNGLAAPNNCTLTRTKIVTVTGPSAPTTTNVSICTGTTATLTASAIATGATIKWYDASTGGNLLFTGNPFTTPTLTAATSYWVTQTTGGCESTRTQVTVSITPGTDATYTLNSTTCAPGSITFSSVSPAATTFDWISGPAGYTFPAGFTTPSTTNTNLTNLPAGTYCVDITSPNVAGGTVTTTLLTENFEANAPNWTINNSGGNNIFVINNTYAGGTCTVGGVPFAVPAVPNQGTWATAGPQSKYLHIKATTTCGFGCAESAFPPANANFCSTTSDQKFTLNTPLSTIGKTNVTVSFQYINKGTDVDDFGALEYSTNGGSTWTQAGANLTGKTAWFNQVTTLPAWNNQASLLFRFRWKNDASSSSDPPLCLDEIIVTAQETAVASCGSTKQECIVINPIVTPTISCGTSTINSVQFTWSAVAGATSYTATHTINGGAAVNDGTITSPFTISGLNPNDAVVITITPVGGSGTCFGSVSLTCTANACPTILTPSANQTLCLGGDPTALSVSTTFTGANAISFVYFTTAQTGSAMYTGGTLLGNVTPSTGTANYNPGVLGTPGSLPNVSGTYFLYAIANPTPAGATCRPFQEIRVVVNSSPLIPTVTTTAATCLINGTASVSNYSAVLNYTSTPVGLTVSSTGVISGFTCGTPYTITATNAATCSSTSTSFTVQCQLAAPLVPTITTTAATCLINGTASVSNYSAALNYTSTPTGLTVSATGVISGFTCGTPYTITATNAATCSATSTSFTVQCQLTAPLVPTVTTTAATCLANGTATVSNYSSTETYTSTPSGLTVSAGGVISGFTCGTAYTITATNAATCSATSTSFTVQCQLTAPLVPTVTTTAATCLANGTATVLNYSSTETYTSTTTGLTVSATGVISGFTCGTPYTITATNAATCTSTSTSFTVQCQLAAPLVPTLTTTAATCLANGTATVLNYSSTETYTSTPTGLTVSATGLISGFTCGTAYTITATNAATCSATSTSFTVQCQSAAPLVPTITTTAATCLANGTATVSNYSSTLTYTSTPTGLTVSATGVISGFTCGTPYTITATNAATCSATSTSFTVQCQLAAPLVPTITTTSATCSQSGSSTISNYNAALTYIFTPSGPMVSSTGLISGMTVGLSYTVIASNGGCLSAASASFATAAQLVKPVLNYTVTNPICDGNTLDFVLNSNIPGTTYVWSASNNELNGFIASGDQTNINQIVHLINPISTSGSISMIISPINNGCIGDPVAVTILVNPIPKITAITESDVTLCSGQNINVNVTGEPSGITYNWTAVNVNGVAISGGIYNGTTTGNLNFQLTTTSLTTVGTIQFQMIPFRNGCYGAPVLSSVITVYPLPGNPIGLPHPAICSGEPTNINVSENLLITGTQLKWQVIASSNVTGFISSGIASAPISINHILINNFNIQGFVTYRITSVLGDCDGTFTDITVLVNPLPKPELIDGHICVNQVTGVTYQGYVLDTQLSDPNFNYDWYLLNTTTNIYVALPSGNGPTYQAMQPGTYKVIVTNTLTNCEQSDIASVVTVYPATGISAEVSEAFSDNATITITVNPIGTGNLIYSLDGGAWQDSNIFTNVQPGTHEVIVEDTEGCTNLAINVLVIDYPKYFTPNGDGIHETWNIIGLNQPDAKLYIFDRYGKLLKQLSPTGIGWDGTYIGAQLPSTDYWFTLDYLENGTQKQFKSHFSLKR